MSASRTEHIWEETVTITADQLKIDRDIVDFVVRHHYSFIKECMTKLIGVRSMFLGTFSVKPKYKRMMKELGYVRSFKGRLASYIERIKEHPEHYDRLPKFNLEESGSGKDCNEKNVNMCELQTTER
jgi:hypothetical protein